MVPADRNLPDRRVHVTGLSSAILGSPSALQLAVQRRRSPRSRPEVDARAVGRLAVLQDMTEGVKQ
jgi:hypothetical protein